MKDGPKPFRLLGEDMVLFLGDDGALLEGHGEREVLR